MTLDTTSIRVRALLLGGAYDAHVGAGDPRTCQCCGVATDTRDGYPVPTPFGEVWVCPACNREPSFWTPGDTMFVGPAVAP